MQLRVQPHTNVLEFAAASKMSNSSMVLALVLVEQVWNSALPAWVPSSGAVCLCSFRSFSVAHARQKKPFTKSAHKKERAGNKKTIAFAIPIFPSSSMSYRLPRLRSSDIHAGSRWPGSFSKNVCRCTIYPGLASCWVCPWYGDDIRSTLNAFHRLPIAGQQG